MSALDTEDDTNTGGTCPFCGEAYSQHLPAHLEGGCDGGDAQ